MHLNMWAVLDVEDGEYELQWDANGRFSFPPSRLGELEKLLRKWAHRYPAPDEPRIVATFHFDSVEYKTHEARVAVITFSFQNSFGDLTEFCRMPVCQVLKITRQAFETGRTFERLEALVEKLAAGHRTRTRTTSLLFKKEA